MQKEGEKNRSAQMSWCLSDGVVAGNMVPEDSNNPEFSVSTMRQGWFFFVRSTKKCTSVTAKSGGQHVAKT